MTALLGGYEMKRFWNEITEKSLSSASLLDDILNWNLLDIKQQCE
jgi:hypothetical protein